MSLCKRRGLIFPASEIYGGIANTYDYGHYGVLLKNNVIAAWWKAMIQERDDIVALDSAIIQHPRTWEASGSPRRLHRPAGRLPHVQAALPRRPPRGGPRRRRRARGHPLRPGALEAAGRPRRLRPHRGARVQPDVRDQRRPRARLRLDRLPAPGDRPGHLPPVQADAPVRAPPAAVRHRPDRQVVPQRDHAGQLRLPHARVRADGDGVLRPARPGAAMARPLARGAHELVRAARHRPRQAAAAPARRRTS